MLRAIKAVRLLNPGLVYKAFRAFSRMVSVWVRLLSISFLTRLKLVVSTSA